VYKRTLRDDRKKGTIWPENRFCREPDQWPEIIKEVTSALQRELLLIAFGNII
jgi:hypothetical protein